MNPETGATPLPRMGRDEVVVASASCRRMRDADDVPGQGRPDRIVVTDRRVVLLHDRPVDVAAAMAGDGPAGGGRTEADLGAVTAVETERTAYGAGLLIVRLAGGGAMHADVAPRALERVAAAIRPDDAATAREAHGIRLTDPGPPAQPEALLALVRARLAPMLAEHEPVVAAIPCRWPAEDVRPCPPGLDERVFVTDRRVILALAGGPGDPLRADEGVDAPMPGMNLNPLPRMASIRLRDVEAVVREPDLVTASRQAWQVEPRALIALELADGNREMLLLARRDARPLLAAIAAGQGGARGYPAAGTHSLDALRTAAEPDRRAAGRWRVVHALGGCLLAIAMGLVWGGWPPWL